VSAGVRLPLGFRPLQRRHSSEPHAEAVRQSRFGSAPRLSQPLSGFLANSSFAALFRAAAVPGISLQSFPLVEIAYPSRGSLASLQSSTGVQKRMPRLLIAPGFTDDRDERVRLDPPTTMSSLSSDRSPAPGCPGCRATGSSRPASFTYFEASLPLRVRSPPGRVSPPRRVAALLGFRPL